MSAAGVVLDLAVTSPIVAAIYQQYEKREALEQSRTYLGASAIGQECERRLWYGFRQIAREKFEGRMLRLFQTGHLSEPRFVADLRSIGAEVYDVNPADGKQFGFVGTAGHMRGHMDGCARDIPTGGRKWHVLEFKTHSAKSFAELKKKGVRLAKPVHYAQMLWYMGKSGMDRALYLAVNKDTDELYAERIEFDAVEFAKLEAKAERIVYAATPPARLSDDPKFYLCNICSMKGVCHEMRPPALSCRTCVHSTPEADGDGRWSCMKAPEGRNSSIPIHVQRTGCPQHLPLPFLITWAEAHDAGDGWIEFVRRDNGRHFVIAAQGVVAPPTLTGEPTYSSAEISAAQDHRVICDEFVDSCRTDLGARLG